MLSIDKPVFWFHVVDPQHCFCCQLTTLSMLSINNTCFKPSVIDRQHWQFYQLTEFSMLSTDNPVYKFSVFDCQHFSGCRLTTLSMLSVDNPPFKFELFVVDRPHLYTWWLTTLFRLSTDNWKTLLIKNQFWNWDVVNRQPVILVAWEPYSCFHSSVVNWDIISMFLWFQLTHLFLCRPSC